MSDRQPIGEIAVLGAAGYVGQRLCADLRDHGLAVTGVCRPYAAFLLERLGIPSLDPAAAGQARRFPVVINLAYPTRGAGYTRRRQNREIMQLVDRLVEPGGHVIHVSSLAVFGFALDAPVVAGPVALRADNEYCMSKIAMEHALLGNRHIGRLQVVRLGNVWGPACPNWTVGLIERLRAGKPVGVRGRPGWSNATDVGNVCSYLRHLLLPGTDAGMRFHHLAEFGDTPWSRFVDRLATDLNLPAGEALAPPAPAGGRLAEFRAALRGLRPAGFIRGVMDARHLGADARAVLSRLPAGLVSGLKKLKGPQVFPLEEPLGPDDADFLRVIGCQQRFASVTDAGWRLEVTLEQSFERVGEWMREAGYV